MLASEMKRLLLNTASQKSAMSENYQDPPEMGDSGDLQVKQKSALLQPPEIRAWDLCSMMRLNETLIYCERHLD